MNLAAVFGSHASASDADLCKNCRSCVRTRGQRDYDERRYCLQVSPLHQPPQPVTVCSHFADSNHPTLSDLYESAWILTGDVKKKGAVGFVSPSQRQFLRDPVPNGRPV